MKGEVIFEDVFFHAPEEGGNLAGTLQDDTDVFDGIACNDRHMTLRLADSDSRVTFLTPGLITEQVSNTVEFWFKVDDDFLYESNSMLFSMVSSRENPLLYYHIYIQQGELKCAPFGTTSFKDPIITFTQFSKENEDVFGWWHISCSSTFEQTARGTLFNTKIGEQSVEETMVGLKKYYPMNPLIASFGKQPSDAATYKGAKGLLVKEFRFWNRMLERAEIETNRYRQIDTTKLPGEDLLVYLRMATGSTQIGNLAVLNPESPYDDNLSLELINLQFIEDFIEAEKYSYDEELDIVRQFKLRTYHTVCPVHSYYLDQFCYNEPVNEAIIAIFPRYD